MNIHINRAYIQGVKGPIDHQKKVFEAFPKANHKLLKEDPPEIRQLKQILKDRERALENSINEQIAKKIARGETVTEAERQKLQAADPEKLRKAEEANRKRVAISRRLAHAKTKQEAATIIASEKSMALSLYENGDQERAELYLEAIDKAETDHYQGKKSRPESIKDPRLVKHKQTFDVRL